MKKLSKKINLVDKVVLYFIEEPFTKQTDNNGKRVCLSIRLDCTSLNHRIEVSQGVINKCDTKAGIINQQLRTWIDVIQFMILSPN